MTRTRSAEAQPQDGPSPQRRGRWFEEFETGQDFVSAARTVTEADVALFAGLSGDFNPLHVDAAFAERTAFRGRIAHGLLVESVASGLAAQTGIFDGTIAALAEVGIRFERPVRPGDSIFIQLTVEEVDPEPSRSRGWVRFGTRVFNQRGERVVDGHWVTRMLRDRARRSAPEEGP